MPHVLRQFFPFILGLILLMGVHALSQNRAEETGEQSEDEAREQEQLPSQSYEIVVEDSISYVASLNTVATKLPIPLQTTPASIGVVTAPLFQNQDARVLGDALRNVSGVVAHTGFGIHDFFVIRGFDSLSNGLVLTDGAPEPEVTFYHLYNVDRVEVLKGPAAFLYGANPLSGAINLVRKQPVSENLHHFSGSFGSFQTYEGTLDVNRVSSDGRLAFRLNVFGRDSDFYRDDKDNRQIAVNPALTWNISERSSLTVDFEYLNSKYNSDSGLPLVNNQIPDVPRTRSYQSPLDISDQEIYRLRLDFSTQVNDRFTLRNKFYFTDLDWRSEGTLFNGVFPNQQGTLDVFRVLTRLDDRQKLVGNQFEGLFSLNTGTVHHTLLSGFEFNRLGDDFTLDPSFLPPIGLFNPMETARRPLPPLPGQSQVGDTRSLVFAPYFVDQIAFSDEVQLFLGGRFDVIDYEDDATNTTRDDSRFSPLAGISYSPLSDLTFYANAGQAFAPPSTLIVGDREPEESTQFEAGVKKQFEEGRIETTLAVYHLEKSNIAIPDDNGVTRQTGDQRARGIELDLAGELGSGWYAFASYAFNDAELTDFREQIVISLQPFAAVTLDRSGNRPAFAPKHLFSFWAVKELAHGISLGGGGRYISDQFIAEDNAFRIDKVFLLDAAIAYRFDHWRWSLNFKNITDRDYETRGFGSTSVIPASPFAIYTRIELEL